MMKPTPHGSHKMISPIESLTQASIFSPPHLASSLLVFAGAQRVQVSTRWAAVNSTQPKHSQDSLNVST